MLAADALCDMRRRVQSTAMQATGAAVLSRMAAMAVEATCWQEELVTNQLRVINWQPGSYRAFFGVCK
jgi:hypothetical protein